MRYLVTAIALVSAHPAFASLIEPPVDVPELSAVGALAAIAGVGAVVALVRERRNRRD